MRAARARLSLAAGAALCLAAAVACQPRDGARAASGDSLTDAVTDTNVLTGDRPVASRPLDLAAVPPGATALEVTVSRVENPGMAPFTVRVRLALEGGGDARADTVVLGEFSAYPPDRPGRYAVGVPPRAAALLRARRTGTAVLVFEFVPISAGAAAAQPVRVHVGSVVWRGGG